MDAYEKPVKVGALPRITAAERRRMEQAWKAERARRDALTPAQREAEDQQARDRMARIDAAIAAEHARNTTRRHFDSLHDYCTAAYVLPVNERVSRQHTQRADGSFIDERTRPGVRSTPSWYGTDHPSPDVAARRATHGWMEGAREVQRLLEGLDVAPPVTVKRKVHRADQGDELDIHAVNRGALDVAWTTRRRKNTHGPRIVRIVAQTNLLNSMSSDNLFWRGAAVVKLADVLTEAGYTVEVVAAHASGYVDGQAANWLITFPLKHAQSPLDMEGLAGVVCNAGFHRTYGLRAYEACATKPRSARGGKGDHSDRHSTVIQGSDLMDGAMHTFVVPYDMGGRYAAKSWIEACCKQLDANQ